MAVDQDGDIAKVSEYVTIKVGLPNYSHVEISFGHSRPCDNTAAAIRTMGAQIHKLNKSVIEQRVQEYVELAMSIVDDTT